MLRRAILIGVLLGLVYVGVLAGCDSEEARDSSDNQDQTSAVEETGEQATQPVTQRESAGEVERTAEETSEEQLCTEQEKTNAEREEIRIGDFAPPEGVPAYEVLEEEQVERDCVGAVRLLVDTQAKSEADYTLIAREIKSEYQDLDAVTIEFTDTTGTLSYNGSALIFNTPPGVYYMGFIYGPPNNEGYFVTATKD